MSRPAVIIEKAYCSLCRSHGSVHVIVTGKIAGENSGLRLTNGCKATFGIDWKRITDRKERAPWVKKFWKLKEERD